MRTLKRTAIATAAAQVALLCCGATMAQTAPTPEDTTTTKAAPAAQGAVKLDTVVVKGQRKALETAQTLKQNAEEVVDSVVAEEAGKLPDKSLTEVLQRVVGVTVQRVRNMDGDAAHFSEEGSGIKVRGLPWGISNLNGREIFSAGWPGKDLSWGAVPTELMAGVDVYKNPSAERIEGGVSGMVDLRTHLPFDFKGNKGYVALGADHSSTAKATSPSFSALYSTQWDSDLGLGHFGALIDVAVNHSTYTREDLKLGSYAPRTALAADRIAGKDANERFVGWTDSAGKQQVGTAAWSGQPGIVWTPSGVNWSSNTGTSDRQGFYGALQWKKNDKESALSYFHSKGKDTDEGSNFYASMNDIYASHVDNAVVDANGVVTSGHYTYPVNASFGADAKAFKDAYGTGVGGGIGMGNSRFHNTNDTSTAELAWNFKWKINDRWSVQNDLQWVNSKFETNGREIQLGTFMPSVDITTNGSGPVQFGFDQATRDFLADPGNYYWKLLQPKLYRGESNLYAWKADARFRFDDTVLRDFRFGARLSRRDSLRQEASFASDPGGTGYRSLGESWQTKPPGVPSDWRYDNLGFIKDPNYPQGQTELFNYSGLVGGRMGNLPSVVFPTFAMIQDYPNAYNNLVQKVDYQRCVDKANNMPATTSQQVIDRANAIAKCSTESFNTFNGALLYGQAPQHTSDALLYTNAVYGNLRFGFDDWRIPVDGNVGLRAVYTKIVSHGHISFNTDKKYDNVAADVPRFANIPGGTPLDVTDDHTDYLPSLNLKANLTDKLQARLGLARSLYRPDFRQLQENITLNQNINSTTGEITYTGENSGNSKLRPIKADSLDVSLEWYPKPGQSITAVAFYKDVKDIIFDSTYTRDYNSLAGTPQSFLITGPANMAQAKLSGIELAADSYLDRFDVLKDKLPDWAKGVGVSANYTYIDPRLTFYRDGGFTYCPGSDVKNAAMQIYGCDVTGLPFKDKLPMQGVTKNAANFALRYDRNGFSARLAYNWTDRTLIGVAKEGNTGCDQTWCHTGMQQNTTNTLKQPGAWYALPIYQEAYGQWDFGASYYVDKWSVSFNVSNITNVTVRETQEQAPGVMGVAWRFPGQNYSVSAKYEF